MVQHVQDLIDKIKTEGIQAAEKKAQDIEAQAHQKAKAILEDAKRKSEQILNQVQEENKRVKESTEMAIKQAMRDMLLELRKQILVSLHKVTSQQVSTALTPESLAQLIATLVKNYAQQKTEGVNIQVLLSSADLETMKKGLISKLQDELKKNIDFQATESIQKGFTITFDKGKSNFDFTDTSLAEYLSAYLNPEVTALLKESVQKA